MHEGRRKEGESGARAKGWRAGGRRARRRKGRIGEREKVEQLTTLPTLVKVGTPLGGGEPFVVGADMLEKREREGGSKGGRGWWFADRKECKQKAA